jgi:SnoaL-like polyketide cyclase
MISPFSIPIPRAQGASRWKTPQSHSAARVRRLQRPRDPRALRTLYDPAARTHRPGWPEEGGLEELLAAARMDAVAFTDLLISPLLWAAEGGQILTEVRITGTNTGEIVLGDFGRATADTTADAVGATGKPIYITGVIVHEVDEEGLVVAERQYWGLLELLTQLGLFSTVPPES